MCLSLFVVVASALPLFQSDLRGDSIPLVSFSGTGSKVAHTWKANNDPVMGGQSYSTVVVERGILNFTGACKIVPKLKAPGFITAVTSGGTWADVSSCSGLTIVAKAATAYKGYRISFGHAHPIFGKIFAYGYKAHFSPTVGSFGSVSIPFVNFTDFWDDATGKPIHNCGTSWPNSNYCPSTKTLADMGTMSIWAEGVEGVIHLEVKSVSGYGCSSTSSPPPPPQCWPSNRCCSGPWANVSCCPGLNCMSDMLGAEAKYCFKPTPQGCAKRGEGCFSAAQGCCKGLTCTTIAHPNHDDKICE